MPFLPLELLKTGASELGIELSDHQLEQFDRYASVLVDANSRFNLTRITSPEAMVTDHILDSLLCLWAVELAAHARVIDVGTGAGFPGLAIKIVRPDLQVDLLDGTAKKVGFLRDVIAELGLADVEAVHARAEELGRDKAHRERYDLVTARALADLTVLAELCLPFARPGGRVIACKGPEVGEELAAARQMISKLNGTVEKTVRTRIPTTDIGRTMVVMTKIRPTPNEFPRHYSQIAVTRARHQSG